MRLKAFALPVLLGLFLLAVSGAGGSASSEPPGLTQARQAQERHTDALLAHPGVVGTGITEDANGRVRVAILTESAGVRGLPRTLDGVPTAVLVTGEVFALHHRPDHCGGPPGSPLPDACDGGGEPDTPGITVTPTSGLETSEAGGTDTFTVVLETAPTDAVTINLSTSDTTEGTIDQTSLSFDATNWNSAQTVTVTGVDDGADDGDVGYTIVTSAAVSADPGYDGMGSSDVSVTNLDDDGAPSPGTDCIATGQTTVKCAEVIIGVSGGHPDITAGTIGAFVNGSYILTNNHVAADSNGASLGDDFWQPGSYDGGTAADDVGDLAAFVPIDFSGGDNEVDAALVALDAGVAHQNTTPSDGYGTPSSTIEANVGINDQLLKYGRTTGETECKVWATNVTVNVNYGDPGVATFVHQLMMRGGGCSAGGDSGSMFVTKNGLNPVGLLFAGGSGATFANPIASVLAELESEPGVPALSIDGT